LTVQLVFGNGAIMRFERGRELVCTVAARDEVQRVGLRRMHHRRERGLAWQRDRRRRRPLRV